MQNLPAYDLSATLRTETKTLHTAAERAGIMPAMLRSQIDRATYCRLLRSFHAIYAALEAALAHHTALPPLRAVHFTALRRTAALAADLNFLHGPNWAVEIPLARHATRYVERIDELNAREPVLLLAHSYVRYLGDLSGGQMLRNIVGNALQLQGEAGVAFYIFGAPGASALAILYRQGLRAIDVDAAVAAAIVAEAQSAFRRHIDLFEELADAGIASAYGTD